MKDIFGNLRYAKCWFYMFVSEHFIFSEKLRKKLDTYCLAQTMYDLSISMAQTTYSLEYFTGQSEMLKLKDKYLFNDKKLLYFKKSKPPIQFFNFQFSIKFEAMKITKIIAYIRNLKADTNDQRKCLDKILHTLHDMRNVVASVYSAKHKLDNYYILSGDGSKCVTDSIKDIDKKTTIEYNLKDIDSVDSNDSIVSNYYKDSLELLISDIKKSWSFPNHIKEIGYDNVNVFFNPKDLRISTSDKLDNSFAEKLKSKKNINKESISE